MTTLRVAELETLFTANVDQIEKAEKTVKSTGDRIEKKPIKATVTADEKPALAGMDRVEKAAKKLVSADTALKLDADIGRAEKGLERAKQRLEDLQVRALGGLDVTADTRRVEAAMSKIERNLDALRTAKTQIEIDANTKPAQDALDAVADGASEAGEDAGSNLGDGIIAALVSIPIAGAVVALGKAAADSLLDAFNDGLAQEQGFDRLQGLTGLSEMDAMRFGRAAGEAYANVFGESIEANMDTARLALQFNLIDPEATNRSAQRIVEGLSGIADVLGEDIRPIAATVATLLSTGIVKSADEAFDLIATGAREGVNRSEDLLDTLTEYPALFARLGLTGPEALGLISQGLDAGARNSDIAADALKEFQIRATDASETSAAGFEAIGLNAEEMTAKIAAGGTGAREGLDQVLDGLRNMEDPVARNAAAVALFGTQAEDLGAALFAMDLTNAVDQLGDVEGAARRMFDTLADNDATKMEQAQRNIEVAMDGIKGALAAAFSEPLGEFAEWVSQNRGPLMQFLLDLANGALDFGESMVISTADGTEALGEFVAGPLREAVKGIRELIEWLPGDTDLSGLDSLIEGMGGFDEKTSAAADTMRETLLPGISDARDRLNEFGDGAVAMGFLNDASLRLASSLGEVGYGADGALIALDGIDLANLRASDSGRLLEDQVRNSMAALSDEVSAAQAAGEAQEALTGRYNAGTEALVGQLTQMGLTEAQARALIDTVLQTPTSATTAYSSNAAEEQGKVQNLASRIETLPDGSVVITADTSPAYSAIQGLVTTDFGAISLRAYVNRVDNAGGNIVEFMASGGLTPMQPTAQMVPPNTWRVVGDRGDVSELYAPLDGSARSWALLLEGLRRMPGTPPRQMGAGAVTGAPSGWGASSPLIGQVVAPPGQDPVHFARQVARTYADEIAGIQP